MTEQHLVRCQVTRLGAHFTVFGCPPIHDSVSNPQKKCCRAKKHQIVAPATPFCVETARDVTDLVVSVNDLGPTKKPHIRMAHGLAAEKIFLHTCHLLAPLADHDR
jgi:hypothetical protein